MINGNTCIVNITRKYRLNLQKCNYIVLGLGYTLKQIIENTIEMIYVIDKDETFYEIMKELNLLGGIISNNRVKFFFGDEYKKVNLDNYIIYNNENATQIHTDFYYKVIKYFTSQSQCNVKKKIAFYEHVTIADDCIDDFKNL
ncbi:hypothetical protein [Clostridium sp. ZBS20]|uniref:hypothetical protein n=1 Tax=Clostridium sp. ZBS20 TaxID=2949966 RepID=UPI00207A6331|nr:hypothetical protein [Clostridium sp. ZBS20]